MHARLPFAAVAMWVVGVWAAAAAAKAADEPQPQFTHHTSFGLSFSFKQPHQGRDDPREVHLHVSRDRGVTWNQVDSAEPSQKKFLFKSSGDAEYWFMLRTKFASGGYLPAGPPVPELKVVVDTAPPQLVLSVSEGKDGEVNVRWHLSDPHLAAQSFKVEYKRAGIGGVWQRVAVDPLALEPAQTEYNGATTIVPFAQGQSGAVVVRAEIADLAGNRTVDEKPLDWAKPAGQSVAASRSQRRPAAADRYADRSGRWEPESASGSPSSPSPSLDEPPPEMADAFGGAATPRQEQRSRGPVADAEATAGHARPNAGSSPSRHPAPTADPFHPQIASQRGPREPEGGPEIRQDDPTMPSGAAAAHMVNKERFELVYEVDSVGSAGVAQIELWVTEDAGKSWQSFGIDDDARSPMMVAVDGEGLYGFRVVVRTTTGVSSSVPVAGELPDVWVGVDLTRPTVKLVSAEQGSDDESDQLAIEWRAGDERLAERPMVLRYAEAPDGPWTTIAAGLENSGRYLWRIDPRLPDRVYVQVEARDEAGNVAIDQLAEPVSLKQVRPQSRIRGVHPLGVRPRVAQPLR